MSDRPPLEYEPCWLEYDEAPWPPGWPANDDDRAPEGRIEDQRQGEFFP